MFATLHTLSTSGAALFAVPGFAFAAPGFTREGGVPSSLADVLALVPLPWFVGWAAVLGLCLGSFYALCVTRYLEGSSVTGRSHCPACHTPLRAVHLVPVFSWLILGRRCALCHTPISPMYAVVESLSAVTAALLALRFGPSVAFVCLLVLTGMLIVASAIDCYCLILPDHLTLPGAALALACAVGVLHLPWALTLGGGLGGAGLFWLVRVTFKHWRGVEGLGLGDVKLMLMLGFLCGAAQLPLLLLLSSVSALLTTTLLWLYSHYSPKKNKIDTTTPTLLTQHIPFGPFLSAGGFITLVYGNPLALWLP